MRTTWDAGTDRSVQGALSEVCRVVMMGSYADDSPDLVAWDPAEGG